MKLQSPQALDRTKLSHPRMTMHLQTPESSLPRHTAPHPSAAPLSWQGSKGELDDR